MCYREGQGQFWLRKKLWDLPKPGPSPNLLTGSASSSKRLDCPGPLMSFKTLLLTTKGFFCSASSFEERKSLLEGDRFWHCPPQETELFPCAHKWSLQPCPSYWSWAFVLSQFGCLPAKNRGGCNAGAIKGTIFRPHFNLIQHRRWGTGPEGGQTKGMPAGTESRQVGQGNDKEISLCGEKAAHGGSLCCPRYGRQKRGSWLQKIRPSSITGGVTKKNQGREVQLLPERD